MKPNVDKCNLLVTTEKSVSINIDGSNVKNKKEQKLLGIKFDSSFGGHITSLCKNTSQKLHAPARIVNYMDLFKRKVLMKAFITSQFSYCTLIWMLHSRTLNNRINNIHKRTLRLTYKDNQSSFRELLEKDDSVTVHLKDFPVLVTEIFKIKIDLTPDIMKDVFELKEPPYNLRSESNHFTPRNVKATYYGLLSVKHLQSFS